MNLKYDHIDVEGRATFRNTNTHQIVSAQITMTSVGGGEVLPMLLSSLRRRIDAISGDGACDTKQCYEEVAKKNARPIFLPRSNAAFWNDGNPRNEAVEGMKAGELKE